jgi:hypothetical protein
MWRREMRRGFGWGNLEEFWLERPKFMWDDKFKEDATETSERLLLALQWTFISYKLREIQRLFSINFIDYLVTNYSPIGLHTYVEKPSVLR